MLAPTRQRARLAAAGSAGLQDVKTKLADGRSVNAALARPRGQGKGSILLTHEWWGFNDYVRGRANMLAELGYTALAVDMHGGGEVAGSAEEAGQIMNGVLEDMGQVESRMKAAGADLRFIAYPGALHGFTNPDADTNGEKYGLPLAYHADTDRKSWQETQACFKEIFA